MTDGPDESAVMPRRAAGVEVAELDGELVVLVPADRRAHHLDPGLSVVFDACDGATPRAVLAAEVAAATASSFDDAHAYLGRAIQLLRTGHLLGEPAD